MDKTTTLDRAGEIAIETKESLKIGEEPKGESKDAPSEKEKEKVEGNKLADVEKKAQEDEKILSTEDEKLSEEEKTRKTELLKVKESKLSPDDKIKRVQEESQKRIDEIKNELHLKENKSSETIKALKAELEELKKSIQPRVEEDEKTRQKKVEQDFINKCAEEDKGLPLENRREMSKDDLDAWYIEDPVAATEWIQERTLRRAEFKKSLNKKTDDTAREMANEFIEKQNKSLTVLLDKYPDVKTKKVKVRDMFGKSDAEIDVLMAEESEIARAAIKICNKDSKKYIESVNGPELVMQELDKLFGKKEDKGGKKTITLTQEELDEKVKEAAAAEVERLANLDEAPSSTKGKKVDKQPNKSQLRQRQEEIAKKAKIKIEDLDKTIKRRESMNLSSGYQDDEES